MNYELSRTFLEVLHHRSFSRAAKSLHITQTAVTTRMQKLEAELGCILMERHRGGIRLTPQGESFVPYARQMVQLWEQAREMVPRSDVSHSSLQIGGELSLWNPLLLEWLIWLRGALPTTALRAHVELARSLVEKVLENVIDIAVTYSPRYDPRLQVELLMEDKLVMVRTTDKPGRSARDDYVSIDWGPEFNLHHEQTFPERVQGNLSVGLGPLALQYILRAGGSGYFRSRAVEPFIATGDLVRISNAPEFIYPVYLVMSKDDDGELIAKAVAGLRDILQKDIIWQIN